MSRTGRVGERQAVLSLAAGMFADQSPADRRRAYCRPAILQQGVRPFILKAGAWSMIAGFVPTAVPRWTGRLPVCGWPQPR